MHIDEAGVSLDTRGCGGNLQSKGQGTKTGLREICKKYEMFPLNSIIQTDKFQL